MDWILLMDLSILAELIGKTIFLAIGMETRQLKRNFSHDPFQNSIENIYKSPWSHSISFLGVLVCLKLMFDRTWTYSSIIVL